MIGWRLKNRLFGWHYVHAKNTCDDIVRRVRRTANGDRYIVYFSQHLVFIDRPGHGWKVTDLTGDRPEIVLDARVIDPPMVRGA